MILKISVVIPAYNAAETIAETLASLQAQTHRHWEALIVDDGSTDETAAIAQQFAQRDGRFRLLRQPHKGAPTARNQGIRRARHAWLLFLDADDWIAPNHMTLLTQRLAANPELDAVYGGCVRVTGGEQGPPHYGPQPQELFAAFTATCAFQPNACLVRREVVTAVGGFDISFRSCQDWDFWQRIARSGARFDAVREVVAYYRTRPGSVSLQPQQLLMDGLRVITQGHAPDPRLAQPAAAYAAGMPAAEMARKRLHFVCWTAGLTLGMGEDARPLLQAVAQDRSAELDPEIVSIMLLEATRLPHALPAHGWDTLWPQIKTKLNAFLQALERHSGTADLARRAMRRIAEAAAASSKQPRPHTFGHVHTVEVELTRPLAHIHRPEAGVTTLRCEVTAVGQPLGHVTLAIGPDGAPPAAIACAIAQAHAWPILGSYFHHTIYSRLRTVVQKDGVSVWRNGHNLAAALPQTHDYKNVLHDTAGWLLLLQTLWDRPQWTEADFYNSDKEEPAAARKIVSHGKTAVNLLEIPDLIVSQPQVTVVFTIGGTAQGEVVLTPENGIVRAQQIRAAILHQAQVQLAQWVVHHGLIGRAWYDRDGNDRSLRRLLLGKTNDQPSQSLKVST